MNGCFNCTSATVCRSCNTTGNFQNVTGKCVCRDGYVNRSGICKSCA